MTDIVQGASPIMLLEWWKPVVGFEQYYEISNVGNVCRVKPYNAVRAYQLVKQWPHWDGRLFVVLSGGGKRKTYKIHKMMVDAFLGGTPQGQTVQHEDACYTNNRLSNFGFLTSLQNWRHGYQSGLMVKGEESPAAKVTEDIVREIRRLFGTMPANVIGRRFGLTGTMVSYIARRKAWKHVA